VHKPGQFDLPANQDLHVLDALALAGGLSSPVADSVLVVRRVPGREEPVLIQVSVAEAKRQGATNVRLAPGDIVSVEHTPITVVVETIRSVIHFGIGATAPIF